MSALKYFPVSPESLGLHPLAVSLVRTGICLLFSWKINSALGSASAFWARWQSQQEGRMSNTWRITSKKGKSLLLKLSSATTTHYCQLTVSQFRQKASASGSPESVSLLLPGGCLWHTDHGSITNGCLVMRLCGAGWAFPNKTRIPQCPCLLFHSCRKCCLIFFSPPNRKTRFISVTLYVFLDQLLSTQVSVWDCKRYKVHISSQRGHVRTIFLHKLKSWPRRLGPGLSAAAVSYGVEKGRENGLLQVPLSSSAIPEHVTLTNRATARMSSRKPHSECVMEVTVSQVSTANISHSNRFWTLL